MAAAPWMADAVRPARVAGARSAERGAHGDRSTLHRLVGGQHRERALQHLERIGDAARRAGPVIAHQVVERELDDPAALLDNLEPVHVAQGFGRFGDCGLSCLGKTRWRGPDQFNDFVRSCHLWFLLYR